MTIMPPAAMAPMLEAPFEFDWALNYVQNSKPTGAQTTATQGG